MTSIGRIAVTVLAFGTLRMCAHLARRHICNESCFGSNASLAEYTTSSYTVQGLAAWQRLHPLAWCPADLAELDEWMSTEDARDPWGREYRGACRYVRGAWALVVSSAGPDGRFGTADDIRSER